MDWVSLMPAQQSCVTPWVSWTIKTPLNVFRRPRSIGPGPGLQTPLGIFQCRERLNYAMQRLAVQGAPARRFGLLASRRLRQIFPVLGKALDQRAKRVPFLCRDHARHPQKVGIAVAVDIIIDHRLA